MPKTKWTKRRQGGFTLIELLVVIAILGILIAITIGVTRGVEQRSRISRAQTELAALSQALEQFRSHYGDYPWITSHTGEEAAERSRILFQSLMGLRGPGGQPMTYTAANRQRTFLNPERFNLGNTNAMLTGEELVEDTETYFLDPWGNPYEYFYKSEASPATWENSSFVLFSKGPGEESKANDPPADGRPDYNHPANADNIYANR